VSSQFDSAAARATLIERGLNAVAADEFLTRSLLTATEAATVLGVKNSRTARDTLRRWGINPLGRGPGRTGESTYPADLVWRGHQSRPGKGWRKGRAGDIPQKEDPMATRPNPGPAASPWYADHSDVVRFATILVESAWLPTPSDVVEFFARPWKWEPQFQAWEAAGRPEPPSAADRTQALMLGHGTLRRELERKYVDDEARWGALLVALEATESTHHDRPPDSAAANEAAVAQVVELDTRRRKRDTP
jgi:hypothetical protein